MSADLADLVASQLQAHQYGGRVKADGPSLQLNPKAALSLALALHELATNASKYGALSTPSGEVLIRWSHDGAKDALHLTWEESGGPRVEPPLRKGFGSRLIERALAADLAGQVVIRYPPEGVTCTIKAPLNESRSAYLRT
jgi:two-component sensor histidine kinase